LQYFLAYTDVHLLLCCGSLTTGRDDIYVVEILLASLYSQCYYRM